MTDTRIAFVEKVAPCLKKRVKVFWTQYPNKQERAAFLIDGQEVLRMYDWIHYRELGYYPHRDLLEIQMLLERDIIPSSTFRRAVYDFSNLSRDEVIYSTNPVLRAFGMLDKRVGKRTLEKIEAAFESKFVQRLLRLRLEAEGMKVPEYLQTGQLTDLIKPQLTQALVGDGRKHQNSLTASNKTRDIQSLLKGLLRKEDPLKREDLDTPASIYVYDVFSALKDKDKQELFCQSIIFLLAKSKLVDMSDLKRIKALCHLAADQESWLKPLKSWQVPGYNETKQLASLLRHLFATFEMPLFMDSAWSEDDALHRDWYKHIGAGKNIRTATGLPVVLTSAMAHYFLQAPPNYSINGAIRYGQIMSLSGNQTIADACICTRLEDSFQNDDFTLSFFRFLVKNPMLDTAWVGPMIDFLWQQKFEDRVVHLESGEVINRGPESPNLTMKGRTVDSLLKQVENWHNLLGRGKPKLPDAIWTQSKISPFTFVEGQDKNQKTWRIRELSSTQALRLDGLTLKHCVVSFADSCKRGESTIWSMTLDQEKILTIEVSSKLKKIRQVRGLRNRMATPKEKEIISRWAQMENLEY